MNVETRASLHANGRRAFAFTDLEIRADEATGLVNFDGTASFVDFGYQVHDQFGSFEEEMRSGSFNKAIADGADVALFVNHQSQGIPLATRSSKTLDLFANPHLRTLARMNPARHDVQDVRTAVADGQLPQMSIGFRVPKGKDEWNDDYTKRTIHEVQLREVSIVWEGANPMTSASVRSLDDLVAELPDDCTPDELRRAMAALQERLDANETRDEEVGLASTVPLDHLAELWAKRAA